MREHNKISIEGAFGLERLTGFEAHVMPGKHARAVIEGIAGEIDTMERWQKSEEEQEVTVKHKGEAVFCGLVEHASFEPVTKDVYRVRIHLISGSTALDREKVSMSFQDTKLTYVDIAEKAVSSTPGASILCTAGKGEKPGRPMIQYGETDWEFAARLASRVKAVLYPEVCRHGAYLWFGIPECGEKGVKIEGEAYAHGISSRFYELGGDKSGYKSRDFEYYRVGCGQNHGIGAKTAYAGGMWRILEKHIQLLQEEFRYTYILGRDAYAAAKPVYNPMFVGQSIHGTVIKTGGDAVRLYLKIDKKQDVSTAHPYPWVPDTGSVMYCMPETGTKVSLYFPDEDERNAIAVNCIRQNGASCSGMSDPSKRALTTAEGKRLYLEPGMMGFDVKSAGHAMSLEDGKSISFRSGTTVNICAVENIGFFAKKITVNSPQALNILRDPEN